MNWLKISHLLTKMLIDCLSSVNQGIDWVSMGYQLSVNQGYRLTLDCKCPESLLDHFQVCKLPETDLSLDRFNVMPVDNLDQVPFGEPRLTYCPVYQLIHYSINTWPIQRLNIHPFQPIYQPWYHWRLIGQLTVNCRSTTSGILVNYRSCISW